MKLTDRLLAFTQLIAFRLIRAVASVSGGLHSAAFVLGVCPMEPVPSKSWDVVIQMGFPLANNPAWIIFAVPGLNTLHNPLDPGVRWLLKLYLNQWLLSGLS